MISGRRVLWRERVLHCSNNTAPIELTAFLRQKTKEFPRKWYQALSSLQLQGAFYPDANAPWNKALYAFSDKIRLYAPLCTRCRFHRTKPFTSLVFCLSGSSPYGRNSMHILLSASFFKAHLVAGCKPVLREDMFPVIGYVSCCLRLSWYHFITFFTLFHGK